MLHLLAALILVATPHAPQALPLYVHSSLDDLGLSPYACRIAMRIARRWSPERGCNESVDNMADGCLMDRKTAWKAVGELVAWGVVERTARPGKPSRYDFRPASAWRNPSHETGRLGTPPIPRDGTPPIPRDGTPPIPRDGTQRDPLRDPSRDPLKDQEEERAAGGQGEMHPGLTAAQDADRRRLLGAGVYAVVAERLVRERTPEQIQAGLDGAARLRAQGQTAPIGGLVAEMIDGRRPLPAHVPVVRASTSPAPKTETPTAVRTDADREALSRRNAAAIEAEMRAARGLEPASELATR